MPSTWLPPAVRRGACGVHLLTGVGHSSWAMAWPSSGVLSDLSPCMCMEELSQLGAPRVSTIVHLLPPLLPLGLSWTPLPPHVEELPRLPHCNPTCHDPALKACGWASWPLQATLGSLWSLRVLEYPTLGDYPTAGRGLEVPGHQPQSLRHLWLSAGAPRDSVFRPEGEPFFSPLLPNTTWVTSREG